ncbi:sensor histidine kinase [Haematomicrobium sanguinis]|uniref:sensor histidine kinase n=1 Tax=Haematomicrobium sanguinis TaxID=479106 RepID=UPI00047B79A6|nr:histidine kinase [Haematomicrobium sanguinis]
MPDSALNLVLAICAAVLTLAAVAYIGFRFTRSTRDLGSDADHATYRTLHTAALASTHLRSGLNPTAAARAAKHLSTLVAANALVITDREGILAQEGKSSANPGDLLAMAQESMASGRTTTERLTKSEEAIAAPVRIQGEPSAAVVVLAPQASAGLIRATGELAVWLGSQMELAQLEESRTLLMEAEIKALRAQISPHFIYNSLNAIASFIHTDPPRARELVLEFADFTRYSFRRQGDFTTLAEELENINRYLELERARFGDRLKVQLNIGPEVLSTIVPFLSLQPLVENAVRHGLQEKEGSGLLTIEAYDDGTCARVRIEDNGVGMDPDELLRLLSGTDPSAHVGMRNVDLRMRQVYGEDYGLVVETQVGAGTMVQLRFPKSQPTRDEGARNS